MGSDPGVGGQIVGGEEGGDDGAEFGGLLQVRAVTGVGEYLTDRTGDVVDVRLPGGGVASSNSPAITSVGAVISGSRSMTVQPFNVPTT